MDRTTKANGRQEPEVKQKAKLILKELGIPMTSAHRLFYRQIIAHRGLPFEARIPNQETVDAMHDARLGKGKRYESVRELFKDCEL
jgi:DNA-damage-inducible protein J